MLRNFTKSSRGRVAIEMLGLATQSWQFYTIIFTKATALPSTQTTLSSSSQLTCPDSVMLMLVTLIFPSLDIMPVNPTVSSLSMSQRMTTWVSK